MDFRRWWLLAGALSVAAACVMAAVDPALRPVGDVAVVAAGLTVSGILWWAGGRSGPRSSWRLLAAVPLFPVLAATVAAVVDPVDPLDVAALRWLPMASAYLLGIVGFLRLVEPGRLRAQGRRAAVEMVLFLTVCLVVVQVVVIGPRAGWSGAGAVRQLVLGSAVLTSSAAMAAALTVLGAIGARRQLMALTLLGAAVMSGSGHGLSTAAVLSGDLAAVDVSRFLAAAGLGLMAAAALVDPGPAAGASAAPAPDPRATELGQVLPYGAAGLAVTVVGTAAMIGDRPPAVVVAGALLCVLLAAVHRWVTVRSEQQSGARLRRSEAFFRSVVTAGDDAVLVLDDTMRINWASPAQERLLGAGAGSLAGVPFLPGVHPDDVRTLAHAVPTGQGTSPDHLSTVDPESAAPVVRLRHADGTWRYVEIGIADLRTDPDVAGIVLHCRDVTARTLREQALESVAYIDPTTGLPNRAGCLQALEAALAGTGRAGPGTGAAFLLLELDGLEDARAHEGRDGVIAVVTEVARRLRATVRADDMVARFGGGTFGILAGEQGADADQLADRCLAVVEQPIVTGVGIVELTASVGLVALDARASVSDVLVRAELAVSAARTAAPGTAARYTAALGEAAARRDQLRRDLHGARGRGELHLLFQPIVSVAEQRITGVEALLHWRHPILGDVPPLEFVPIAERAGLIGDLQRWALEEAMSAVGSLSTPDAPLRLSVDAPAGYVAQGTLIGDVETALRRCGFGPERLVLEITEATVMSDQERVARDITTLRLMGVHVALDDFGSGHSSLTNLTRLPIDMLKLDRAFVSRVDRDAQSRALCESVVGIGRALRLDVVAEGVETPSQLAALSGFGIGFAQGFLLARPMPLESVATLLRDGAGVLWPGLVGSR